MYERYECYAVTRFLANLAARTPRTSGVASALVEWLATVGETIGAALPRREEDCPFDRPPPMRSRRRPGGGRWPSEPSISPERWKEATAALERRLARLRRCAPSALQRNVEALAADVGLGALETELLGLGVRYALLSEFEALCDRLWEANAVESTRLVADLLGAHAREVAAAMAPGGRLAGSCAVIVARHAHGVRNLGEFLHIPHRVLKAVMPPSRGAEAVRRRLLGPACRPSLAWEDFEHLGRDRDLVAEVLAGAKERRARGVNVLLYGPPGTGKTEFAKTVAARTGLTLYCAGESDEEGGEPSRDERLASARIADKLLAGRSGAALLFDEMEDLLSCGGTMFDLARGRAGSKVFVNRLLEGNGAPILWTCNDLSDFDRSLLRRMTLALELSLPPASVRERLWRKMLRRERMPLPDREVARLAREIEAPPAVAHGAVRAAKLAGGGVDRVRAAALGVAKAMRGGVALAPAEEPPADFDLRLLSADQDLAALTDRLASRPDARRFSLCLYGPPGTGKSAYARHLAERLGLEALQRRASDLISPYVGETEQRIAAAFAEAEAREAVLVFDEADSFLQDRRGARRSWEITQVNEMLTWMERHLLPFVCTTNLMQRLDPASLRRFTFKVRLDWLRPEQVALAFRLAFDLEAPGWLAALGGLTPGDFAVVRRRAALAGGAGDAEALARMVAEERGAKSAVSLDVAPGGYA